MKLTIVAACAAAALACLKATTGMRSVRRFRTALALAISWRKNAVDFDHVGRVGCASLLLILLANPASAQPGRDFLLTQTTHLPERGQIYAIARQDFVDEQAWEFAGIASYEARGWMLGFNLLADHETLAGAEIEWGYAAGARRSLTDKVAAGLEIAGTFEDGKQGEVLLGVFADPLPWLTVNVGIGTGFNHGADLSFRSAFIFQLR